MTILNIISCADAKSQGLKRYYTGAACRNGHVAERLVSNKACVECKRERERVRPSCGHQPANPNRIREQIKEQQIHGG